MTTLPPITVRLLGDANIALLGRYLANDGRLPTLEVLDSPFGQLEQQLAAATPTEPDADVAVVWARPEAVSAAFAERVAGHARDDDMLVADVEAFADRVLAARRRWPTILVPSFVRPPWHRGLGTLDLKPNIGIGAGLLAMNVTLARQLDQDGVFVLDADRWIRDVGAQACPPEAYFAGKMPFAPRVFERAAGDVRAALDAIGGRAKKLIVLDLDDTLWGGIVGDVGIEGLRLGGHDAVGEAFVAFQHALLALHRRGIQLAIASKNEERTALEAIDHHPEMVLGRSHFAAWRIGWGDKAQSIVELTEALNLGLDAVVFIDDNPVERGRVGDALPDVLVPDWPRDPCRYVEALGGLAAFDTAALSAEDRNRGSMYEAERARRRSQEVASTLDSWLEGLEQVVLRRTLDETDLPRTAQLLNKTNQMNLATRRMTAGELSAWASEPGRRIWTFRVRDRFGDAGLTGILSVETRDSALEIVDFVLSCRVMARRIEETMLATAIDHARTLGLDPVIAHHRPTARNAPCLTLLRESGMREASDGRFAWDTARPFPVPEAVRLEIEEEAERRP